MKTNHIFQRNLAALALLSSFSLHPSVVLGQGSLTPPGAPGVTMKSLDQIEPRKPIYYAGFGAWQPGSYYLTTNLTCASGQSGISVTANNVTIDLNGFSLTGSGSGSYGVSFGSTVTNFTLRNGTVNGFYYGIGDGSAGGSANVVLDGVTITGSGSAGVWSYRALTVRNCLFFSNSTAIFLPNGGQIIDCTVNSSSGSGIYVAGGEVRHCRVTNNGGIGIDVAPGVVSDCWVQNNALSGICVDASVQGGGSEIIRNICNNNNTSDNGQHAGIRINVSGCRVEDNHVSFCWVAGIAVTNTLSGNIIVKNSVWDTISGVNYLTGSATQFIGPIITTQGTITNTSPWANFSY